MSFTLVDDVNVLILIFLDDKSLIRARQMNKAIHLLSKNNCILKERIEIMYKDFKKEFDIMKYRIAQAIYDDSIKTYHYKGTSIARINYYFKHIHHISFKLSFIRYVIKTLTRLKSGERLIYDKYTNLFQLSIELKRALFTNEDVLF